MVTRCWREMLRYCLLLCVLAGLLSCGGRASRLPVGPDGVEPTDPDSDAGPTLIHQPTMPSAAKLPALPKDAPVDPQVIRARRTAAVGQTSLLGSQVFQTDQLGAAVDTEAHTCSLQAGAGQMGWAMYRLSDLLPEDVPLLVNAALVTMQNPDDYHLGVAIGISDYPRGAWDWTVFGIPQEQYSLPAAAGAGAISPGGNMYLVVAAWDGQTLAVQQLNLQLDCPNPPPAGFNVDPGDGVQVPVHLSWTDPALTYDPDGAGPGQFSYAGVQVRRAESPDGPWTDLALVPPGTTEYDDPGSLGNTPPEGLYFYDIWTKVTNLSPLLSATLGGGATLGINQLIAKMVLTPGFGPAGVSVTFNASSSVHSGPLTKIMWDYDGNGVWDKDSAPALTYAHAFPKRGRYYPKLKLIMSLGGSDTLTDIVTGYLAVDDVRGDWSQPGRGGNHAGRSPLRGPKTSTVRGSYTAGGNIQGLAVDCNNNVIAAGSDGNLYYLSAAGVLVKKVSLGKSAVSPPAIDMNGFIWLNLADGIAGRRLACVWSDYSVHTYPPGLMSGNPVVTPNGLFVVAPAGNQVFCARPSPGTTPWYFWVCTLPFGWEASTPAIDDNGNVYFAAENALYKLNSSGVQQWRKTGYSVFFRDPTVSPDGTLYALTTGNQLFGFDAVTGENRFAVDFPDGDLAAGAPAVSGEGVAYVSTNLGRVYAFNSFGGAIYYPPYYDASARFVSPPVIDADGNLYLLTADGRVVCLTRKLHLRWSYSIGGSAVVSTLAIGNDGTLFTGGTSKVVGFK